MRKIFLTVFTVFVFAFVNAQDAGQIEFGANLGLNISSVSDVELQPNTGSLSSFNAAVSGEYYFSDSWGLKAKIIFDSKGWSDGSIKNDESALITTDFKLNYISIPVLFNWHFGEQRNWYLHFGPYIGLLTNAEATELDLDFKDELKSTDLGLDIGFGYKYEITRGTSLYLEYDWQSSFIDISDDNDNDRIRNTRHSFNFGILFYL